jgi:ABC-type nitrate/sulfonate/bicarbonate transport system substrate-binding protein
MIRKPLMLLACAAAAIVALAANGPAVAQGKKIVLATPGIPPIFATVIAYVAEKQGLFKKHGVNVEVRPFDNGTAAARAVIAGDVDMSLSPTPPVINQISNAGVPLVAIYGMNNPDWILATTEAGKTCKDIVGQAVGVDSIGGARSVALRSMLVGCPGVKLEQANQVALGSNTAPAMIAGRLSMKNTNPTSHYLLYVARQDHLKANRDGYVRAIAGLIEAARFMQDPKNADKVAEAAKVTGHDAKISKAALKIFLGINFWATTDDGMDRTKLEAVAKLMKKIGAIKADKEPVSYDKLVDTSVWKDANAMVK